MCGVEACPCVDDGDDFRWSKIREGEIMRWSEGDDVAFAGYRLGMKEE